MATREVTELDLRAEEFKDPRLKLEDLEIRDDGKIVRKDRWEQACRTVVGFLELNPREFELGDMLNTLDALLKSTRRISDNLEMGRPQNAEEENKTFRHAMGWLEVEE